MPTSPYALPQRLLQPGRLRYLNPVPLHEAITPEDTDLDRADQTTLRSQALQRRARASSDAQLGGPHGEILVDRVQNAVRDACPVLMSRGIAVLSRHGSRASTTRA